MKAKTFVCVLKSGGRYDATHANRLFGHLKRFNPEAALICLTDLDGLDASIDVRPLRYGLRGWFSKLEIFELSERPFVYVDLDVVITGTIDLQIPPGLFLLRDFRGTGVNSSVMLVNGDYRFLLADFLVSAEESQREYSAPDKWGDQDYIRDSGCITGYIQDLFPDLAGSWKNSLDFEMGTIDDAPRVLVFHGSPKPEDLHLKILGDRKIFIFSAKYLPKRLFRRAMRSLRRR